MFWSLWLNSFGRSLPSGKSWHKPLNSLSKWWGGVGECLVFKLNSYKASLIIQYFVISIQDQPVAKSCIFEWFKKETAEKLAATKNLKYTVLAPQSVWSPNFSLWRETFLYFSNFKKFPRSCWKESCHACLEGYFHSSQFPWSGILCVHKWDHFILTDKSPFVNEEKCCAFKRPSYTSIPVLVPCIVLKGPCNCCLLAVSQLGIISSHFRTEFCFNSSCVYSFSPFFLKGPSFTVLMSFRSQVLPPSGWWWSLFITGCCCPTQVVSRGPNGALPTLPLKIIKYPDDLKSKLFHLDYLC